MQSTYRALLDKLHNRAAAANRLKLGWIALAASSCSLDSSPEARASAARARAAGWQPSVVEQAGATRARSGLDAALASESAPSSRPRGARDAGTNGSSDRSDAGGGIGSNPRAAAGASGVWDAEAPSSMPPSPNASQDASAPLDGAVIAIDASSPGASQTADCQPGDYTGDFSGTLQAAGIPVSKVTGPITASLTLDDTGLYLDMRDVLVAGRDARGNTVRARVSGKVNCMTHELEEGQLERGRYFMASRRNTLSFDGVAQGAYSTSPYALHGTWSVSARAAMVLTGEGVFDLVRSE
jgi:hypothetical protein